mmetsp:Transcript_14855/g.45376  ORF Transcript_14855/g.45376 Transcript_14855/m.45376 type:complete len:200 (-) Transcript_14855:3029-3628(-)
MRMPVPSGEPLAGGVPSPPALDWPPPRPLPPTPPCCDALGGLTTRMASRCLAAARGRSPAMGFGRSASRATHGSRTSSLAAWPMADMATTASIHAEAEGMGSSVKAAARIAPKALSARVARRAHARATWRSRGCLHQRAASRKSSYDRRAYDAMAVASPASLSISRASLISLVSEGGCTSSRDERPERVLCGVPCRRPC